MKILFIIAMLLNACGLQAQAAAAKNLDTVEVMAYAFAMVESRGNQEAYNSREDAVGILQIRPIMLREANRVAGEDIFTLDDRWDAEVSVEIFRTIMEHHNPTMDIDRAVDIWNPRCPASYRQSVKQEFENALKNNI